MLSHSQDKRDAINAPVRNITGSIDLCINGVAKYVYTHNNHLKSFTVERVGMGKFFGYGVCQKLNIHLVDTQREINVSTVNDIKPFLKLNGVASITFPNFYVTEVNRDENTNELSITAYDALYKAAEHTAAEITLTEYTLAQYAEAAAALLGLTAVFRGFNEDTVFDTFYPDGANLEGTESIREVLDAIAEATQCIYFVNAFNQLIFKRLGADVDLTIDKEKYFTLESKTNRRLAAISSITELGDNVGASLAESGSTQYIRDNPFLDLREDVADLINNALNAVGGLTINQFNCEWRGNMFLEIGDKIELITKDNNSVYSYLLNDTLTYDGAFKQVSQWSYEDNESETECNPTTIGEALKQTYAKVDKANKEIEILASETTANEESIAALWLNTESISASVQKNEVLTDAALSSLNESVATLNNQVSAQLTAEDVKISIQSELANGVDKVITHTGYTLNDEGLTINKSGSEMTTLISEDGMKVFKNEEAVLTANNIGVDAVNLHATTYLIIGNNSRLEDYADDRTGCFWIGGVIN